VDFFPSRIVHPSLHRPSSMVQSIPQVSNASKWHINTKERVLQRARRPHAGVFLGCFLVLNSSLPRLPTHHRSLIFVFEALYSPLTHNVHRRTYAAVPECPSHSVHSYVWGCIFPIQYFCT
jgi:hypothetical protein